MRQLAYRAERAERSISERAADENDDSIRRTLVLAQRTADLAVREAEEQAAEIMDTARNESEKLLTDARENAQRLSAEAERRHKDDIARFEGRRDQVVDELRKLSDLLDAERERLAGSLRAALSVVEETLSASTEISELGLAPSSSQAGVPDDIEAQINEDAAAAAPSIPPADAGPDDDDDSDAEGEGGRANLAAVPPLEDSGPNAQARQAGHMVVSGRSGDNFGAATADTGSHYLGGIGSDWIA
jgi:vacuolar-type H+-ATPase subunit H